MGWLVFAFALGAIFGAVAILVIIVAFVSSLFSGLFDGLDHAHRLNYGPPTHAKHDRETGPLYGGGSPQPGDREGE
jgi:hypothetical protein